MCVRILHTHCLMNISVNLLKLNAEIELNSISMSKNDPKITKLDKYDVEANIEEVENTEEVSVYKYGFTALSNSKNVRLSIEGVARIFGDSIERNEILEKDENDVPKILTMIYHELFPCSAADVTSAQYSPKSSRLGSASRQANIRYNTNRARTAYPIR